MKASEVNVGMFVRVRPYEDIGDECRHLRGEHYVLFGFPENMKEICGKVFQVICVIGNRVKLNPHPVRQNGFEYNISAEMLTKCDNLSLEDRPPEHIDIPEYNTLF